MEIHIGTRSGYFCNLKAVLIFLVVYGHFIEKDIYGSELLMWQYRLIYSVHMPLFAFVSGAFLQGKHRCFLQMKRALLWYLFFQGVYVVIVHLSGNTTATFVTPYWHLWYLLSLSCWAGIALVLELIAPHLQTPWKKALLVLVSVIIACAVGNIEAVDRTCSLSRTLVFLPYVLLGRYVPVEGKIRKVRILGILAGMGALGLCVRLAPHIPVSFLYQADSYAARGVEHGELLRLLCFFIGAGLGFFLLVCIPRRRTILSRIGTNTLWIYVFHAPIVRYLQELRFWEAEFVYLALGLTVAVVLLLYKTFQWQEKLYRIV